MSDEPWKFFDDTDVYMEFCSLGPLLSARLWI